MNVFRSCFPVIYDLLGQRSFLHFCGQSYGICLQKMFKKFYMRKLWSIAIRSYILIHFWLFWSEDDPNSFLGLINPQFDINNIFLAQKPSKIWLYSNGLGAHESLEKSKLMNGSAIISVLLTIHWRKKVFLNSWCTKQIHFDELQRHNVYTCARPTTLSPSIGARKFSLIPCALKRSKSMNCNAIIATLARAQQLSEHPLAQESLP